MHTWSSAHPRWPFGVRRGRTAEQRPYGFRREVEPFDGESVLTVADYLRADGFARAPVCSSVRGQADRHARIKRSGEGTAKQGPACADVAEDRRGRNAQRGLHQHSQALGEAGSATMFHLHSFMP